MIPPVRQILPQSKESRRSIRRFGAVAIAMALFHLPSSDGAKHLRGDFAVKRWELMNLRQ